MREYFGLVYKKTFTFLVKRAGCSVVVLISTLKELMLAVCL